MIIDKIFKYVGILSTIVVFGLCVVGCSSGSNSQVQPQLKLSRFTDSVISVGESTTITVKLTNAEAYNESLPITILSGNSLIVNESSYILSKAHESTTLTVTAIPAQNNIAHITVVYNNESINSSPLVIMPTIDFQELGALPNGTTSIHGLALSEYAGFVPNQGIFVWAESQESFIANTSNVSVINGQSFSGVAGALLYGNESGHVYSYSQISFNNDNNQLVIESGVMQLGNSLGYTPTYLSAIDYLNTGATIYAANESGRVSVLTFTSAKNASQATWSTVGCGNLNSKVVTINQGLLPNGDEVVFAIFESSDNKDYVASCMYPATFSGTWSIGNNGTSDHVSHSLASFTPSTAINLGTYIYATTVDNKLLQYNLSNNTWSTLSDNTIENSPITAITLTDGNLNLGPDDAFGEAVFAGTQDGRVWRYSFTYNKWNQIGNSLGQSITMITGSIIPALFVTTQDGNVWFEGISN